MAMLLALVLMIVRVMRTVAISGCPLDLSHSNFTLVASLCSSQDDRAKCCRYINALVAISVSRYANETGDLGISSGLSDTCLSSIAQTFELYGVTRNAMNFCGFGTKIPLRYECQGRKTVKQMVVSKNYSDVAGNCMVSLLGHDSCRKCLNSAILYLRSVLGPVGNTTLSTCRDATFAALASQVGYSSSVEIGSCFFQVQGLISPKGSFSPQTSPIPPVAASPSQLRLITETQHPYHLTLVTGIGIAVTVLGMTILMVLILLIRRKKRELRNCNIHNGDSTGPVPLPARKFQDGPTCMFRKFSYKEVKKGTNNFSTVIGEGGFGIVYKAEFRDGLVTAVKRMSKASDQAEDDFCRELELLARLHHRHLVALKGFCIEKRERFLMYEYMANGSLKDHLQSQIKTPLRWNTRIQIAIDVANALEYLHFYCNPPLCHRDIKSSNILLDENYTAKVADFGLAHASKDGSICFEPVNTDVRGTPGYMDPEYVVTQELTEKSDIYSYGVVLLELVTGRQAIQDNKNLIEWSREYMAVESRMLELVDPNLGRNFNQDQLQTLVKIVKWCTQREGQARPSIKQVRRLLCESADPLHSEFAGAVEDEGDGSGRIVSSSSRGKKGFFSGERGLASSSSTTRSCCSRSYLIEMGSPQSPSNIASL